MRALVIDDAAKAEAARVISYAMEHPYHPRQGAPVPGDDPGHVAELNTFRAVFSFTVMQGQTFRQLSISVPGGLWPNPWAVCMIAELFGFTGWDGVTVDPLPASWMAHVAAEAPLRHIGIAQMAKL